MREFPDAFFLPADPRDGGQRFCLYHRPVGAAVRGLVLYVHPFGEEMNKSRRMAALQSRALAQAGYAVLQLDLLGCGDSSGDFGDAHWEAWLRDVGLGSRWLLQQQDAPLWLWGLRAGCLLAADAARQPGAPACNFLFWAPVASGKTHLQQFLRLKAAGDMLGAGAKGVTEGLRAQLAAGQPVEVAGYTLSPGLCAGLERASMAPPPTPAAASPAARLAWIELSTRGSEASLSPVAASTLSAWQATGWLGDARTVQGPSFWQTVEIEDAPALVDASLAAVQASAAETQAVAA